MEIRRERHALNQNRKTKALFMDGNMTYHIGPNENKTRSRSGFFFFSPHFLSVFYTFFLYDLLFNQMAKCECVFFYNSN